MRRGRTRGSSQNSIASATIQGSTRCAMSSSRTASRRAAASARPQTMPSRPATNRATSGATRTKRWAAKLSSTISKSCAVRRQGGNMRPAPATGLIDTCESATPRLRGSSGAPRMAGIANVSARSPLAASKASGGTSTTSSCQSERTGSLASVSPPAETVRVRPAPVCAPP